MKIEWKTCLCVVISILGLYLLIHYWGALSGAMGLIIGAAIPLLLGCVIAYLINILMRFYEKHYFPKSKSELIKRCKRVACLLLSFLSVAGLIFFVVRLIVPELVSCIKMLVQEIGPFMNNLIVTVEGNPQLSELFAIISPISLVDGIDWQESLKKAADLILTGLSGAFGSFFIIVSNMFSVITTAIISLIFSIYLLIGKEKIGRQIKKLMSTYLNPTACTRIFYVLKVLDDSFHKFIVGQCIEAVILGVLCIAGMMLFQFPYATMIGTLIGFTALIPVAGAYIGAGVGVFMILTVSPIKAILFLIFILILQQLENNLIYPKVVGASIGLPGIWVLAAVVIGGSVMGIPGMLLAVPLAAALYRLLREDVQKKNVAISS